MKHSFKGDKFRSLIINIILATNERFSEYKKNVLKGQTQSISDSQDIKISDSFHKSAFKAILFVPFDPYLKLICFILFFSEIS